MIGKRETAEVYVTSDPIALGAARGVLEEAGIGVRVRDLTVRPYPLSVGALSELRLVVAAEAAEAARELLREAARDGVVEAPGILEDRRT